MVSFYTMLIDLLSSHESHEILWDYCLENNICMPVFPHGYCYLDRIARPVHTFSISGSSEINDNHPDPDCSVVEYKYDSCIRNCRRSTSNGHNPSVSGYINIMSGVSYSVSIGSTDGIM